MIEYEIFITNIVKLREHFGLNKGQVQDLLQFKQNRYSRIENKEQDPSLRDIIEIADLYGLTAYKLLSPKLTIPPLKSLPEKLSIIARESIGKPVRTQKKRDLISHLIIILNTHFKINDTFTNLQIKCHLTWELQNHYKTKSIEWNKSILKEYVVPTKSTQKAATKSQIVYQLIRPITTKMVEHALKTIEKENIASENQSE